jgi:hypothetical protein
VVLLLDWHWRECAACLEFSVESLDLSEALSLWALEVYPIRECFLAIVVDHLAHRPMA